MMKRLLLYTVVCTVLTLVCCRSAKTTSSHYNKAPDLSSIDPGQFDTTWWNRQPYRLVQTNLREIDATMDVDAYVQSMVDASASIVLLNVGGIVANYPTKLPYEYKNPFMNSSSFNLLIGKPFSVTVKFLLALISV